jgi:hypothetical protein
MSKNSAKPQRTLVLLTLPLSSQDKRTLPYLTGIPATGWESRLIWSACHNFFPHKNDLMTAPWSLVSSPHSFQTVLKQHNLHSFCQTRAPTLSLSLLACIVHRCIPSVCCHTPTLICMPHKQTTLSADRPHSSSFTLQPAVNTRTPFTQ